MTGAMPNGMQNPTITTNNASALYGGFLVTGQYSQAFIGGTAAGAPAFILDKDGTYVWWYTVAGSDATGVTMSYDGNYMWINSVNVPSNIAQVHRVSMDGLIDEDHSSEFAGLSHQLTVLPDETVAFYAYGTNGCDDIKLRAPGRDGHHGGQRPGRARRERRLPRQRDLLLAAWTTRWSSATSTTTASPRSRRTGSDRLGLERRRRHRSHELVQRGGGLAGR